MDQIEKESLEKKLVQIMQLVDLATEADLLMLLVVHAVNRTKAETPYRSIPNSAMTSALNALVNLQACVTPARQNSTTGL